MEESGPDYIRRSLRQIAAVPEVVCAAEVFVDAVRAGTIRVRSAATGRLPGEFSLLARAVAAVRDDPRGPDHAPQT
jgi:hypothetical protein